MITNPNGMDYGVKAVTVHDMASSSTHILVTMNGPRF